MKDTIITRNIIKELLEARKGWMNLLPKLIKSDISVGLNEQHPLPITLNHQLPRGLLSEPPRKGVVGHQRPPHRLLDHLSWVTAPQSFVIPIEIDHGDLESEHVLVVNV